MARRTIGRISLTIALTLMAAAGLPAQRSSEPSHAGAVSVIVRSVDGRLSAAKHYVEASSGTVDLDLGIINGFSATIAPSVVDRLRARPEVASVSPDQEVELLHSVDGYDPRSHKGSLYNIRKVIGALDMADRGFTGRGVDVALIDSGVAPVRGLNAAGQVVSGPDLSFEGGSSNLRNLDTFGHGTHMAGIIAGRDGSPRECLLILCSGTGFQDHDDADGVAPEARIVSVKVANALGATDVSQVIAAIDWVVQHRRDNGLNIRVLNLSFGTDGIQDYRVDPLAYAAEVAWHKGIVVVAAAGNSGYGTAKLNNPSYDPYLIAVGAMDAKGTTDASDDVVPDWSSRGSSTRRPDVVAPGDSVISFRTPNSHIDQSFPMSRINSRFMRGGGTSQAAAVVSGAAALLIDQRPALTPDQVKALLTSSATLVPNGDQDAQGSGRINLFSARVAKTPVATQTHERSTGTGSLEAARGSAHVISDTGEVTGEQDVRGQQWDGNQWSTNSWNGVSWSGGSWSGNQWSGGSWNGNQWSGNQWSGNQWSGNQWSGGSWSGNQWSGNQWSGNQWSTTQWSGGSWFGWQWQ